MKKMKVVEISRERVKPSSPTPPTLRHYKLSFIDQFVNRNVGPFIFYYQTPTPPPHSASHSQSQLSIGLKKSLSEALTMHYPLAGRLKEEEHVVNCNDEGVLYVEAIIDGILLSHLTSRPNEFDLNQLLPPPFDLSLNDAGDLLFAIQVSFFDCGGVSIAMCFSHKSMDVFSLSTFANCWASLSRQHVQMVSPPLLGLGSTLFPPRPMFCGSAHFNYANSKIVGKRFVCAAPALSALKSKYATKLLKPSTVEALSAFIWGRFVAITGTQSKPYMVVQAINIRVRKTPALPDSSFGNFGWFASALVLPHSCPGGYGLTSAMRSAISKIDNDYVMKLQQGFEGKSSSTNGDGEAEGEGAVPFIFSSVWKFPLYKVDFGWGRPDWVGTTPLRLNNMIVFLPTRSGDGIEAWINMREEDMVKLEADHLFTCFLCPTTPVAAGPLAPSSL